MVYLHSAPHQFYACARAHRDHVENKHDMCKTTTTTTPQKNNNSKKLVWLILLTSDTNKFQKLY